MRRSYHNRTYTRAVHFSLGLLCLMTLSLVTAMYQAPAIIVGSEMNADGSVEYLCLGASCEGLPQFHWAD